MKALKTFFFLHLLITSLFAIEPKSSYKVIGYFPNWGMYRNPSFKPQDIDPSLITHLNYAFAKVDVQGNIILFDPWADTDYRENWNSQDQSRPYHGHFRKLYELKKKHPHLKTLISLGGWTLSDTFSALADNPLARKNLAQNIVRFCKQYDFDGVDIDWEYPCFEGHMGRAQDTKNFTLLLEEIHLAAKSASPKLLVTIAAPAGHFHYKNIEVEKIHKYLDWINLMTYDFHGAWPDSKVTNHHSGLYPSKIGDDKLNVYSAVEYYLSKGTPREKLVVGLPLYGRSFANAKATKTGLFSPYSGPGKGTTEEAGMRFFYDIKKNLVPNSLIFWDDDAKVPYLYNPETSEFVTYDDETSLHLKCQFIKDLHLGGAMVWELGLDVRPSWDAMKVIAQDLLSTK